MSMDDPVATAVVRDTDMSEAAADDQDLALGQFFLLGIHIRIVKIIICIRFYTISDPRLLAFVLCL